MTETPARYGLPSECPTDHACFACPHNAMKKCCHPPEFCGSGSTQDVLQGSLVVLHFLQQAFQAMDARSPQAIDERARQGAGFILRDIARAIEFCCGGDRCKKG